MTVIVNPKNMTFIVNDRYSQSKKHDLYSQ